MRNSEEINTIKQFLITLLVVVLCVVGIYFFTKLVVLKQEVEDNENQVEVIDATQAIVGTMLNRAETEYYVLVVSKTSADYTTYNSYKTTYGKKDKSLKVYVVDLDDKLNEKYIASDGEEAVTVADSIEGLKFKTTTLIKVKDGKITKSFTTEKTIKKEWSID